MCVCEGGAGSVQVACIVCVRGWRVSTGGMHVCV